MSEQHLDKTKPGIVIPEENEEFHVEGFSEAYEAFLSEDPSRKIEPDYFVIAIGVVGMIMMIVGAWNLLVEPPSIENKALSGIGTLIMFAALKISDNGRGVSATQYLAAEYELFDDEGPLSEGYAPLKYLGESRFRVKY